jgi:hypothetical protein
VCPQLLGGSPPQARLKKAGTAWLPEHADQIAHLRVLRANDQWFSLWN